MRWDDPSADPLAAIRAAYAELDAEAERFQLSDFQRLYLGEWTPGDGPDEVRANCRRRNSAPLYEVTNPYDAGGRIPAGRFVVFDEVHHWNPTSQPYFLDLIRRIDDVIAGQP